MNIQGVQSHATTRRKSPVYHRHTWVSIGSLSHAFTESITKLSFKISPLFRSSIAAKFESPFSTRSWPGLTQEVYLYTTGGSALVPPSKKSFELPESQPPLQARFDLFEKQIPTFDLWYFKISETSRSAHLLYYDNVEVCPIHHVPLDSEQCHCYSST